MEKYWIIKFEGKVYDRALYTSKDDAIIEIHQNPLAFADGLEPRSSAEFDIVEIEI